MRLFEFPEFQVQLLAEISLAMIIGAIITIGGGSGGVEITERASDGRGRWRY